MSKTVEQAKNKAIKVIGDYIPYIASIAATTKAAGVVINGVIGNTTYSEGYKTELIAKENKKSSDSVISAAVNIGMNTDRLREILAAIYGAQDVLEDNRLTAGLLAVNNTTDPGAVDILINQFKGDFASLNMLAAVVTDKQIERQIRANVLSIDTFERDQAAINDLILVINQSAAGRDEVSAPDFAAVAINALEIVKIIKKIACYFGVDFDELCNKNKDIAGYLATAKEYQFRAALGL